MTTTEKYGYTIMQIAADSEPVKFYVEDHLRTFGYPPDTQPSSVIWFGIFRDGQTWGVIGAKPLGEKLLEIPDFYLHRSRWGILGGYAGLEAIRAYAEGTGTEVITATPIWNTRQLGAIERVFGVKPVLVISRFRPWESK